MIPSLRAGRYRRTPRTAITWSITWSSWQAPPIANCSTAAIHSFSVAGCRSGRETAVDLVDVAEVAHQVEEEVDPPVIEVREVDARAERALAGVARVVDHAAAEHPDLDLGIEQDQVDGGLGLGERGAVLGVRWRGLHSSSTPARPRRVTRAWPRSTVPFARSSSEVLERELGRVQHRLDQVTPVRGLKELGRQQPLRQLEPLLVGQLSLPFALDLGPRRRRPGTRSAAS